MDMVLCDRLLTEQSQERIPKFQARYCGVRRRI